MSPRFVNPETGETFHLERNDDKSKTQTEKALEYQVGRFGKMTEGYAIVPAPDLLLAAMVNLPTMYRIFFLFSARAHLNDPVVTYSKAELAHVLQVSENAVELALKRAQANRLLLPILEPGLKRRRNNMLAVNPLLFWRGGGKEHARAISRFRDMGVL